MTKIYFKIKAKMINRNLTSGWYKNDSNMYLNKNVSEMLEENISLRKDKQKDRQTFNGKPLYPSPLKRGYNRKYSIDKFATFNIYLKAFIFKTLTRL